MKRGLPSLIILSLSIIGVVVVNSCKDEKRHQWKVKYKEAYHTPDYARYPPSDSAIYWIGNCCPFMDTWDAYDIGDKVEIDSIMYKPYIEYQVLRRVPLDTSAIKNESEFKLTVVPNTRPLFHFNKNGSVDSISYIK